MTRNHSRLVPLRAVTATFGTFIIRLVALRLGTYRFVIASGRLVPFGVSFGIGTYRFVVATGGSGGSLRSASLHFATRRYHPPLLQNGTFRPSAEPNGTLRPSAATKRYDPTLRLYKTVRSEAPGYQTDDSGTKRRRYRPPLYQTVVIP